MNAVTPIEASAESHADILAEFEANPAIVLLDEAKAAAFYAACVAEVEAHTPDLTTKKGRDAITALATKIRNRKASIDKARLARTKDWRDQIDAVNAAGNRAKATYQALEDRARKPLVDWEAEEAEKARRAKAAFDFLQDAPVVLWNDTSHSLAARLDEVKAFTLPNDFTEEQRDGCERLRGVAIAALTTAIVEAKQKERDAADLARLRAQEAERQAAAPAPISEPVASAAVQTVTPPPRDPNPPTEPSALLTALGRAKADLMKVCGLDEPTAKAVVLAIGREQIAHLLLTLESRNAG